MNLRRLLSRLMALVVFSCLTVLLAASLHASAGAPLALASSPTITPDTVEKLVYPGESVNIAMTVTTPEIAPKPDIYFLADTTSSMTEAIATAKANAAAVLATIDAQTSDPRYGAGDYKDFPADADSPSPYAFNNAAPLPGSDDNGTASRAAIAAWDANGGGDLPEGQFYLEFRVQLG